MKKLFRKAVTVLGSAALIGATVGMAAAASYPEPFTSNTAIVVGATAAPSDNIAAASIASNLDANAASDGTTTISTDGDSYKFEKTSNDFNLGDSISTFASGDLDADDLPVLLKTGTYDNDDDDTDYDQTIHVADKSPEYIADRDLNDEEPTLGFHYSDGDSILNYTLDLDDPVTYAGMVNNDLPLMGSEYYVTSASASEIVMLDSAESVLVAEGESVDVTIDGKSYTVSIEYIETSEVKLNVNGEIVDGMDEGDTEELDDGAYVAIKDILFASKDTGISKVEFAIGKGQLTLADGDQVDLNGDNIDEVYAHINNDSSGKFAGLTIEWKADGDLFVTDEYSITMPTFELTTLVLTEFNFGEAEVTDFEAGDDVFTINTEIKEGSLSLPILYNDGTDNDPLTLGEGDDDYLVTYANGGSTYNITLNESQDTYFVVTHIDGEDAETYAYQVTDISEDSDDLIEVTIEGLAGEKDITLTDIGASTSDESIGSVKFELVANSTTETVTIEVSSEDSGSVYGDRIVTVAGLQMMLPVHSVSGFNNTVSTSWTMTLSEENDDGDIAEGADFEIAIAVDGTNGIEADSTNVTMEETADDNDISSGYVFSDLATRIDKDKSGDLNEIEVSYFGESTTLDLYLTSPDSTTTTTSDAGVMTVMDSAVATVAGKNLVVVGGSAINSVAAELLGGAYSEALFTSATGVGAGEFLIQSFDRAGTTALLVAGYNAADTEKAATYLLNNDVDTTVGVKIKGTSATEATVVTA